MIKGQIIHHNYDAKYLGMGKLLLASKLFTITSQLQIVLFTWLTGSTSFSTSQGYPHV